MRRTASRLATGAVSQGLAMVGNVTLLLSVTRVTEDAEFGRFALVYGVMQFGAGITRGAFSEVAAASFASDRSELQRIGRAVLVSASMAAVALSLVVGVIASFVYGGISQIVLVFVVATIPVAIHEHARQWFFINLDPKKAVLLDLIWTGTFVAALLIGWLAGGSQTPVRLISLWAGGAVLAACLGSAIWLKHADRPSDWGLWRRTMRSDSAPFAAEFAVSRGTPEAVLWLMAATGGLADAGAFRLAQVVLGPVSVVVGGLRGPLVAELRRVHIGGGDARRWAQRAAALLAVVPLIYLLVVVVSASFAGSQWPIEQWDRTSDIFAYLAARRSFAVAALPAFFLLRVLSAGRLTTRLRVLEGCISLTFVALGTLLAGASGALGGLVASGAVSCALWWISLGREHAKNEDLTQ